MAVSRAERRAERAPRARDELGVDADACLSLFELVELAWHDCFGEITPPDQVLEDIYLVADGNLVELIVAARLAVEDFRDLRVRADALRA